MLELKPSYSKEYVSPATEIDGEAENQPLRDIARYRRISRYRDRLGIYVGPWPRLPTVRTASQSDKY